MTSAIVIAFFAFASSCITFAAYWRWRNVDGWKWRRREMLMMFLGSVAILSFYIARIVDISQGSPHLLDFIYISRFLWAFILAIMSLVALSDLVTRKP